MDYDHDYDHDHDYEKQRIAPAFLENEDGNSKSTNNLLSFSDKHFRDEI